MSRSTSPPPLKRARRTQPPATELQNGSNGAETASMSANLPPLSLSILGVEPLDEFIKEIADFIHHMIITRPKEKDGSYVAGNVEVEAKVGLLRDKGTGQRILLPVLVESILTPDSVDCRFESNMSVAQHKHYNTLLNNLMNTSSQPSYPSSPLSYSHLKLVDSFYPASDSPHDRDKVRVTRDEKTGTVTECMRKIRLGDLNIYSPRRAADWRVSVSLEVPVSHPLGSPTHTRRKDRMSYAHEEFIIDLTQVTSSTSPAAPPQILHELELEIARPEILLATAATRGDLNVPEHERSAFDELIRAFVNNARILVRNAATVDGWK
ncbi:putative mRNA triphosphatase CET1 [Lyophyllum shimeji]|uniref:mRNA-capping enzyme subunit beta n=1 Tax=Lyophyllum shimeji TaxID=47721 RepID=A0A9P3PML2_LYOSH|nr:putative mRNA triphosphatase CET1 [Lyophyllum shimeji]